MRNLRRGLGLCALLALASMGVAAPLLFPLQFGGPLGAGRIGWRYEREYIAWPGEYWRGADRPPVVADPNASETWGCLHLGGARDTAPSPLYCGDEVTAPLTEATPALNGALGYDEWNDAQPVVMPHDDDQELLLLVQHSATTLYVCLAAPSLPYARGGQTAELYLSRDKEAGRPLGPKHLQFKATLQDASRTALTVLAGDGGQWVARPAAKSSPNGRAAGSSAGDGAWSYPVFEFAIPLDQLGGVPGVLPESIGFMARLQDSSRGKPLPVADTPVREKLFWPDARTGYGVTSKVGLDQRPDEWGHLQLSATDLQPGLAVPLATRPIRTDGQIGLKEWAQGAFVEYRLPGDQYRRLYAARDEEYIYLAVRVRSARGTRQAESCGIYLDPAADGGLRPRSDDVLYRLALGAETAVEELRYADKAWTPVGTPRSATPVKAASYPLSPYESTYEFALPLTLFAAPQSPNLAVEVSYELSR